MQRPNPEARGPKPLRFDCLGSCSTDNACDGAMLRALWTFVVVVTLTGLFGIPSLTIGLFLPSRWCYDICYHTWAKGIAAAAGVRVTVEGKEHLRAGENYFFVGNHQSAMDIPVLASVIGGRMRFTAKRSLFNIPMLGWMMYRYGFVPIDRDNARKAKQSIDRMIERLNRDPVPFLAFPEGTRSEDHSVKPFKNGAMKICQRAAMPIVCFAITGTLEIHRRGVFRINPGRVQVSFAPPITPDEANESSAAELALRTHTMVSRLHEDARQKLETEKAAASAPLRGDA